MNKLNYITKIGFKITWKLIYIGLYGSNKIHNQITYANLFDYLDEQLSNNNLCLDQIVLLICEKDDEIRTHDLIREFANKELSETELQERKWRALMLDTTLDNLDDDCLQGLLQLIEFWVSMGLPEECPMVFPKSRDELSIKNYFTPSTYKQQIIINKNWLINETNLIISQETNFISNTP